jgi:hypothetical protein
MCSEPFPSSIDGGSIAPSVFKVKQDNLRGLSDSFWHSVMRRRAKRWRGVDLCAERVLTGTPASVSGSVRTRHDHDIAVRVPHPALPMIGPAVTIGGIPMTGHDNVYAHFSGPLHDRLEIVDFEPQQHAVPVWLVIAIADRAVMVFYCEAVQLKHKLAI